MTKEEIYDFLVGAKEQTLPQLTSTSEGSVWSGLLTLFADSLARYYTDFEKFSVEMNDLAAQFAVGSLEWYKEQALLFQIDSVLEWTDNGRAEYQEVDAAKRVVKHCATTEQAQSVVIKVAKGDSVREKLEQEELDALNAYFQQIKFAGTRIVLISQQPDVLRLYIDIYTRQQDALLSTIKTNVETTITNYLKNLAFGGTFYATKLLDELQLIAGVQDVAFVNGLGKPTTASNFSAFNRTYVAVAGHAIIDSAIGFTTINYY